MREGAPNMDKANQISAKLMQLKNNSIFTKCNTQEMLLSYHDMIDLKRNFNLMT